MENLEIPMRKEPTQQRSRERVERMLASASELIAKNGSDAMKMGDVAAQAGVSIGSLYQFFPDKSAIIRALSERHTAAGRACIDAALSQANSRETLTAAFTDLIDTYFELFRGSPVTRDIWSGMQSDPALREIELADSRASAATLVDAIVRANPSANAEDITAATFLIWQLGEATVRLAISVEPGEGVRMVDAYKRMAVTELERLTEPSVSR